MRIISGLAKGLQLFSPPGNSLQIRPTSDRSREALFNILGTQMDRSLVLDLYAGTGAFGIESLSRGARGAVFVDTNHLALQLITKNLRLFLEKHPSSSNHSVDENDTQTRPTYILKKDLRRGLYFLKASPLPPNNLFDIIFIDPPYSKGLALKTLKDIDSNSIVSPNGVIIAEDRTIEILPDNFNTFKLTDKRNYGDTSFWFYRPFIEK